MLKNAVLVLCLAAGIPVYAADETVAPTPAAAEPFRPQTGRERWREYARDAWLSPSAYFRVLGPAAGQQSSNKPEEWGQGWDAYGKRVAARFGQVQLFEAMYHGGAAATTTQTEYRRCQCDGRLARLGYALSRTFVTRGAGGSTVPNLPLLGAAYGSAMISTYWYPGRYSPTREGVRQASVQLGITTGLNVIREFGPELKKIFKR